MPTPNSILRLIIISFGLFFQLSVFAQPADIPWDFHPECNSILNTGITAMTCGTTTNVPQDMRYTFGMADINGALPAVGRIDVSDQQDMYHHPAWHIDSIGNVFGIAIDNCGHTYVTASSNYASQFFIVPSVIKYGTIGGGENDLAAAGTIYKIDSLTAQPTVFAVLPQQMHQITHIGCEGGADIDRDTGPGLGNIAFHAGTKEFYVSNFEDGRIYRLNRLGEILESYDPLGLDDGSSGNPDLSECVYGLTVSEDGTELFFGTTGTLDASTGTIYSIPIESDGSFTGTIDNTNNPAGATWDNIVGEEIVHYTVGAGDLLGFSDTYYLSDLAFSPSGDLIVGVRVGCGEILQASYNHGGMVLQLQFDGNLYGNVGGVYYTGGEQALTDGRESYGGVAVFENPNGGTEVVLSSADMLTDWEGPHGICTQSEGMYGGPGMAIEPAGLISYGGVNGSDPKGIGGDVEVFKMCDCSLICPTAVNATVDAETICSGNSFNLAYEIIGANVPVEVIWWDEEGNAINPANITLENTDCVPLVATYQVTVTCLEDPNIVLQDEVSINVYTDNIEPFVSSFADDCLVAVAVDPDCAAYLSIIGEIPEINPGDAGTVSISVETGSPDVCAVYSLDLEYDCPFCPAAINAFVEEEIICSNSTFDLQYSAMGLENVIWTNAEGEIVNPIALTLENTLCEPAIYEFFVTANCVDDPNLSYSESVSLTLVAESILPFIEVIENNCEIGVSIQTACEEYLTVTGTSPVINPGDSGSQVFTISDNISGCNSEAIVLSYDCPLCTNDTTYLQGTTCLPEEEGIFYFETLQNIAGCDSVIFTEISFVESTLYAEADEVFYALGDSTQIKIYTDFIPVEVLWSPAEGLSCTDCLNPIVNGYFTAEYQATFWDEYGCEASLSLQTTVGEEIDVYIPNAFSPNDDGYNDVFYIQSGGGVRNIREFYIFDRWGEMLFDGKNFQPDQAKFGWDGLHKGQHMNPQVLVYCGYIEYLNGETKFVKGDLTLIR